MFKSRKVANMNLNSLLYLLITYFGSEKHTRSLAIMNCMNQENNALLLQRLSFDRFTVLFIPVNETSNPSDKLLKFSRSLNSLGVYLDYNCISSEKIFKAVNVPLY